MDHKVLPVSLQMATTAINAALYAAIGALWTIFPLTVFGVRFWPQVFVPAAFAVLFGPWTGGLGAAIGIFIADVLYGHHDPLLSFLVGVPSNFFGFFVIGWLTHRNSAGAAKLIFMIVSLLTPVLLAGYGVYLVGSTAFGSPQLLIALVGLVAVLAIIGFTVLRNKWADFEVCGIDWPRVGKHNHRRRYCCVQRNFRFAIGVRTWQQNSAYCICLLNNGFHLSVGDSVSSALDTSGCRGFESRFP